METLKRLLIALLITFVVGVFIVLVARLIYAENRGTSGFWLTRYREVKSGPLYERTMEVFRRVVASADRRKGVEPRLHIIEYDGLPWAQSLEDGSIILTRRAVEFCLKEKDRSLADARLAFVIGHELSHQFNGDFWPYRFISTTGDNPEFTGIREFAHSPETLKAMELRADQYGIIYASIAGFRTDAIVSADTNFFSQWARAVDPTLMNLSADHPTVIQRTMAVRERLREVRRKLSLFHTGVIAYGLGWYESAAALFREFLKYYPSREVYHNIGTTYLKRAIRAYREWKGTEGIPFHLSIELEPYTGATSIEVALSTPRDARTRYRENIDRAIEYLKKATESDPYYWRARNNLGTAYILEGRLYSALSELDEALRLSPENPVVLNNRAVAYFLLAERLGNEGLREVALSDMKKLSGIDCPIYTKNLAIAGLVEESSTVADELTLTGAVSMPAIELSIEPGKRLPKKALEEVVALTTEDGRSLGVYEDAENREVVLTENGVVKLVLKRVEGGKPEAGHGVCPGGILLTTSDGRGMELKNGIFFTFDMKERR